jgi:hypothetical protein
VLDVGDFYFFAVLGGKDVGFLFSLAVSGCHDAGQEC